MQYRYAFAATGQLVGIDEISRATRHDLGPYLCPGCGGDLVPALGLKNQHHFRHRAEDGQDRCGAETYLHSCAKRLIAEGFRAARSAERSYGLRELRRGTCASAEAHALGPCRLEGEGPVIDLPARFTSVAEEVARDGFVYDLLFERKDGDGLAVEIAVTHPVSPFKAQGGRPLVEILIRNQADLDLLAGGIDAQELALRSFAVPEFAPEALSDCATSACRTEVVEFLVYSSGKTRLARVPPFRLSDWDKQPILHQEVYAAQKAQHLGHLQILDRLTRRAFYDRGVRLRSCLICQEHALSPGLASGEPIECTARRITGSVNMAADCGRFRPHANAEAIRVLRRAGRGGLLDERDKE